MSEISHSDELVTKQDLSNFYQGILPYLGGMPEMLANKFSKGDLYSTDEKMIGQWINGKPLYQRTIVQSLILPATSGAVSETQINLTALNIDTIIKREGFVVMDGDYIKDLPYLTLSHIDSINKGTVIQYQKSTKILSIFLSEKPLTSAAATITIQYTKTTDSAISIGSDTDYSTTEKIVGTWIDGKPLYQKTFNATTPSTALSNEDIVTHGLSIGTVVSVKGIVIKADANGKYYWDINSVIGSPTSYNGDMRACWVRPNTIAMKVSDGATNLPVIITLQYTKTTD